MLINNDITQTIEHDEITNNLYVIEEHGINGEVQFRAAYADTGEPTNGSEYEIFESLDDAYSFIEGFCS